MTELDDVLRQSFARIAEPGDPAGVVDAIRSRMAAGDTGTPASNSGFGAGAGAGWVVPWLFGGAVLAVGGLVLGTSGLLDPFFSPEPASHTVQLQSTVEALDCPSGTPIATLAAGNRVLAIARSDDSAYLGVRSPYDTSATIWLPVAVVIPDSGEAGIDSLPVDGCGTADTTLIAPTAEPVPTEAPTQQPAANAAPVITGISQSEKLIHQNSFLPDRSVISVSATDDAAVSYVTASWAALGVIPAGSVNLSPSGGTWNFTFGPYSNINPDGTVTITIIAYDAAGLASAPRTLTVDVAYELI